MTTRYFQRFGIPASTALAAGFIDTLSQTIIQISLFLLVFLHPTSISACRSIRTS
jgi:hypothetical protein